MHRLQSLNPDNLTPALTRLAAGISLFALRSSSKVTGKLASPNAPLGYLLCFINLGLDGYTNAAQVGCRP